MTSLLGIMTTKSRPAANDLIRTTTTTTASANLSCAVVHLSLSSMLTTVAVTQLFDRNNQLVNQMCCSQSSLTLTCRTCEPQPLLPHWIRDETTIAKILIFTAELATLLMRILKIEIFKGC